MYGADGSATVIEFEDAPSGANGPTLTFKVRNRGKATLTLGDITLPAGVSLVEGLNATLAPRRSDTFTIQELEHIGE